MRRIPYINLKEQHAEIRDELLAAINRVMDSGGFILGNEVANFEKQIAKYCNVKYAVGLNSGTDALFLTLKAYGIGHGDEVITAPNSFLATASIIVAAGAKPVFADIKEDFNIDPNEIAKKITRNTRAIIPIHLTGKPADMEPILKLAKEYNLKVIEDAAQAIGAEYHGKKIGSLGDVGCFSMHPLKTLNACGDAGMVTTNNEKVYQTLMQLRNIGLKNRNESDLWGYNSRLDGLQAAILGVKIKYLEAWTKDRIKNAVYYIDNLKDIVKTPALIKNERAVFHTFVIQAECRDELQKYLQKNGIETRVHYPIPIHLQRAAKKYGYKEGDYPVCERVVKRILTLPIYQGLSKNDLAYVVQKIRKFYGS